MSNPRVTHRVPQAKPCPSAVARMSTRLAWRFTARAYALRGRERRSMSAADGTTPRLQLLGAVKAWQDERELDLGSAHRRTVLATLAMTPNRAVSREELIDAVWGDAPPASAQGSIYTYISGLRRALEPGRPKGAGPQLLASVGSGYSLRVDADAVD